MKNRSAWIAGGVLLLLMLAACGIGWWLISESDPRVARIEQLQAELATLPDSDEAARREKFTALRTEMESLPEEQRQQLRESMGNVFRQRMTEQIHRFNQLLPQDRAAFLDAEIDRMESRRSNGNTGGRRGGPGGGGGPSGFGGPPGSGPGGGPGGGPRGNRSEEQREARRRSRLDGTSAEQRAEFAVYIEAMRERRKARGLPDRGPRGGF